MRILAATSNPGKLEEIGAILAAADVTIVSPQALGITCTVEEDGATFQANAVKKALAWSQAAHLPALADDSGLCVNALDDAPGIRSARYAGPQASDRENLELLLQRMQNIDDRRARFVCVIALAFAPDDIIITSGQYHGTITHAPAGTGGFGYDPVFHDTASGRTFAQLSPSVKNARSHRRQALEALQLKLAQRLANPR